MAMLLLCRRAALLRPSLAVLPRTSASSSSSDADFFEKNKRLKRPLSPHVSIYRPQWTWTLSIAHRVSGIGLSLGLYGGTLFAVTNVGMFEHALDALAISPLLGSAIKFGISFPLIYHTANGIRHLVWDMGSGFDVPTLERTGKFVLTLSVLLSMAAAYV